MSTDASFQAFPPRALLPAFPAPLLLYFAHFPVAWCWARLLGHARQVMLEMVQISDISVSCGVCFVVLVVNALLFEVLYGRRWFRALWGTPEAEPRSSRLSLLNQAVVVMPVVGLTLR